MSTLRSSGAGVLGRALEAKGKALPPEGARFILGLDIRDQDRRRADELLVLNQSGMLTDEERSELESYIEADNVLSILKATALLALKEAGQEP